MAEFLLVPIHVEALFVHGGNGTSRESRGSPSSPGHTKKLDKKQNKGQGKKQESNNTPDETDSPSLQNLKLDLLPGVHLHWSPPYALTRGMVGKETTSFPNVPNRWLITPRQERSGVNKWVVKSEYLRPTSRH